MRHALLALALRACATPDVDVGDTDDTDVVETEVPADDTDTAGTDAGLSFRVGLP